MTAKQALQVGQRLLGIFLLVTGLSASVGALAVFGFEAQAGYSRMWVVVTSVLQGGVFVAAGIILMRRPVERDGDPVPEVSDPRALITVLPPLLQLLGVYFVVIGLQSLARPALDSLWIGREWQIVAAEIGAGIILTAAGVGLVARPSRVSDLLTKWREAPS